MRWQHSRGLRPGLALRGRDHRKREAPRDSPAIPLIGRKIPLMGVEISAVPPDSGIDRQALESTLFRAARSAFFHGRSEDFPAFSLRAGNFDPAGAGDFRSRVAPLCSARAAIRRVHASRQPARLAARNPPAARDPRRGAVRRVQPRALRDRRLDLPDRAIGRRCAEEPRGRGGGDRDRARGGGAGPAARRRHLAMRPDRRPRARHRLQQISRPGGCGRCRGAAGAGRAGGGARPAQPALAQEQAVLPGRPVDGEPCHDRRHDRQQQLRLALVALRQHGAQCARRRRAARRRHAGLVRRDPRQFRR